MGAAVRLLDGAGVTRALAAEATALVRLSRPAAEILPSLRGPSQRRVLEALSAVADLGSPGDYDVDIAQIASACGLGPDQVRRAALYHLSMWRLMRSSSALQSARVGLSRTCAWRTPAPWPSAWPSCTVRPPT